MKEKILSLRKEGKSYLEIKKILGCSKGTISYHCGEGQKEKTKKRNQENIKSYVVCKKLDKYKKKQLQTKSDDFQRDRKWVYDPIRKKRKSGVHLTKNFGYKDILEKFGENTTCYLTGRPISLVEPKTYSFDHKIPPNKGGDNSIENLGITCREANYAKSDLLLDQFIELCKEILVHHGYEVKRK
jgi:hypothetical protein